MGQHPEVLSDIQRVLRDIVHEPLSRQAAVGKAAHKRLVYDLFVYWGGGSPGFIAPFFHIFDGLYAVIAT